MATVANLVAKLTANTAQFQGAFEQVSKRLDLVKRNFENLYNPINKFKAVLAAAGIAAIAFYVNSIINARLETLRFARTVDESYQNVETLRRAMVETGQDASKYQAVLVKLSQFQSLAASGTFLSIQQLNKLGLAYSDIAGKKPYELFELIASRISKLADANQQAAIAYGIFGDDAASILPILVNGSKALDDARNKVNLFGKSLTDDTGLTKLELIQKKADDLKYVFENVGLELAVRIAPYVLQILDDIVNMGENTKMWLGILDNVHTAAKFIYKMFLWIQLAIKGGQYGAANLLRGMVGTLSALGLMDEKNKAINDDLIKTLEKQGREIVRNIDNADVMNSSMEQWLNTTTKQAKEFDKLARANGTLALLVQNNPLYQKSNSIIESNMTAFEKFNTTISELDRMLNDGLISWQVYGRAVSKAMEDIENANNLNNISLPSAFKKDSTEAISAVNRANIENDLRRRETPQQRLERIQQQSLQIEQEQLTFIKQVADAAKNRKVYTIGRN